MASSSTGWVSKARRASSVRATTSANNGSLLHRARFCPHRGLPARFCPAMILRCPDHHFHAAAAPGHQSVDARLRRRVLRDQLLLGPAVRRPVALWPLASGTFWPWQLVTLRLPARRHRSTCSSTCWACGCSAARSSACGAKRYIQFLLASVRLGGAWCSSSGRHDRLARAHVGASGALFGAAARVRHAVPEPHDHAAVPADPDEGQGASSPSSARCELLLGLSGRTRHRALRAPRRHARRVPDDPLLARPSCPSAAGGADDPPAAGPRVCAMSVATGSPLEVCHAHRPSQWFSALRGLHRGGAGARRRAVRRRRSRRATAAPTEHRAQSEGPRAAPANAVRRRAGDGRRRTPGPTPRSAAMRQGSGVVIGADGLVLTIGYLILEADQVQLLHRRRPLLPARVVGLRPGHRLRPAAGRWRRCGIAAAPLGRSRSRCSRTSR